MFVRLFRRCGAGVALVALVGLQASPGADPVVMAQQAYLKANAPGAADSFGDAIATDGDTVVIGAYLEDGGPVGADGIPTNTTSNAGAAYVYVRQGGAWQFQAYLKATSPVVNDQFGRAVAISGDTIVVGADGQDSSAGAAWVFVRSNGAWTTQAVLTASNPAASDGFGRAVAIHGDTIVVGATGEDSASPGINGDETDNTMSLAGAAYVFTRQAGTWTQQAYLKASNPTAQDAFGGGVAISGDTIVVGAEFEDSAATGVNGNQTDETAVNAGAAYVFVRANGAWSQQAYLKQSNTGSGRASFGGRHVAIDGDRIAVGAPLEDTGSTNSGAVYVFARTGNTWTEEAFIKASNPQTSDSFGGGVGISGSVVVAGATTEDASVPGINGVPNESANGAGAAYVFQRVNGLWTQLAYVKASNPAAGDLFGMGVAIFGGRVVIGATSEDSLSAGVNGDQSSNAASGAGAAYVYAITGLNAAPIALAGEDRLVEATSPTGALATLSGSLSYDTDGDPLTMAWTDSAGAVIATTADVVVDLPIGQHVFSLTVDDGIGGTDVDEVVIEVADTIAPSVTIDAPLAQQYAFGTVVFAAFSCSDSGSGVASCVGDVPSGSPLPTSTGGAFTFTVTATDVAGHSTSVSIPYSVRQPCEAGTYLASISDASCTPAPAGSFVAEAGATTAVLCAAGSFSSAPGAITCTPAPAGSYVPTAGATTAVLCAVGSYASAPGAVACTLAPAGSYVPTAGATSATLCPAGMTSDVGAVSCVDTAAPVLANVPMDMLVPATDASGAVVNYAAPTATDLVEGARAVMCAPPSGSVFPVGATPVTCTASDTAGNTAAQTFTVTVGLWCTAGSYLAAPADASCTPAPAGSYVPTAGATTATLCPTGMTSGVGAVSCVDTAAPVLANVPVDILVSATSASGATVTYSMPTATDVVDGARAVTCIPPSGSTLPIGAHVVTCAASDTAGNTAEQTFTVTVGLWCAAGSYLAAPADATCTPAPAGSYVPTAGATTSTLCPTGMTSDVGAVSCVDTVAPVLSGVPVDMLVPATSASGATVTYSMPTATDVVDGARAVTCIPPSGSTLPIGAHVVTCAASDTAGNTAAQTFTVTVGLWCAAGSYLAAPADATCTPAPAGSYVPTAGATTATLCAAGSYASAPGAVACTLAPAGSYVPTAGATTATLCAAGSYASAPGATTCTLAPAGSYVPAAGATTATLCPTGMTSDVGAVSCVDTVAPVLSGVPVDMLVSATDASGAVVTYAAPTATDVVDGARTVACAPPSGSVFPVGATPVTCTASDTAGNTAAQTFTVTVGLWCAAGSYLAAPADASCTLAPAGSYVPTAGATTATLCAAGSYASAPGATTCTLAPAGSYVPTAGATTATLCAAGSYASAPGATTCTLAPAGSYVPTAGATTATLCPTGMTSDVGAVSCVDTVAPVLSGVPVDMLVPATDASGALVTYAVPTATDVVDGARTVTCAPSSGSVFPVGATPVTCTASDTAGNTAAQTFTVTVGLWCAAGSYLAAPADVTCTPAPAGSYVPTAGATTATLCPTGMTSDVGAVSCVDTVAPVLSGVPVDMLVSATDASGAVVSYATPTATDVVDGARAVTCIPPSGSTLPIGAHAVTCTASDTAGNTAAQTFTVTVGLWCAAGSYLAAPADVTCTPAPAGSYVPTAGATTATLCPTGMTSDVGAVSCVDTVAPVLSGVPVDMLVSATDASGAVVSYATPTATDVVDGARAVTCIPPSGSTLPIGAHVVTCTASDTAGNTAAQTFTVTVGLWCAAGSYLAAPADATCTPAPAGSYVPTAGATTVVLCAAGSYAPAPGAIACTPAPAGSYVPTAGATTATLCPTGMTSDVGAVSCVDTAAPVLTNVPVDTLVSATSASGATVTYSMPTATDVVDGARAVTCIPPSGSTLPIGAHVVTCAASDTAGNTAAQTFTVTVGLWCAAGSYLAAPADATCTPAPAGSYVPTDGATTATLCPTGMTSDVGAVSCVDTVAPVMTNVPTDMLVPATSASGAMVSYATPTATDVVDGVRTVTCAPSSGSVFPVGATPVTCGASDTAGNSAAQTFTVTVGLWCAAGSYLAAPADVTCTPAPAGSYVPTAGATTATLCPTGMTSDVGAVSCVDTAAPVLSGVPVDMLVPATDASGAVVSYATPTATDVVEGARAVTCAPPSGSVFPVGATPVTCGASDTAGNTAAQTFTVTVGLWCAAGSYLAAPADATCTPAPAGSYVPTAGATTATLCPTGMTSDVGAVSCVDTVAPVLSGVPGDMLVSATDASGAVVTYAVPTATDVVDGARAVTCIPPSGSTLPIGAHVVTCTASDTAGNTAAQTFTVTVGLWCSAGSYLAAPADATCTPAPAGSYVPTAGATTATLCPTGMTSDVGAVSCVDTVAPVLSGVPTDMLVPATDASGAVVTYAAPTATDVVDGARTVTCAPSSGSVFPVGATPVTCNASDTAGNTAEQTFTVTVGLWCAAGSYLAAPADATCTPAPAGSYVPTAGATTATLCPTGMTSDVGAVSCVDTAAPVLANVPMDMLVPATSASGATVTYSTPTATDVVDGARAVTCAPSSGSVFPVGATPVTCTASDTAGNTAEQTFTVTVGLWCAAGSYLAAPADATCTPAPAGSYVPTAGATTATLCPTGMTSDVGAVSCVDTVAPVLTNVPADISIASASSSGQVVTYAAPTATDTRDGAVPVACAPSSGTTFPAGVTTVTCSAADGAGNVSTATFVVTVTVSTPDPVSRPGDMRGDGFIRDAGAKYEFEFHFRETERRGEAGSLKVKIEYTRKRAANDRFEATSITSLAFSDDPAIRRWWWWQLRSDIDTVLATGTGRWNGRVGYTFQLRATDQGWPGRHRESVELVIKDAAGKVVAQVSGALDGGHIRSRRIPH